MCIPSVLVSVLQNTLDGPGGEFPSLRLIYVSISNTTNDTKNEVLGDSCFREE